MHGASCTKGQRQPRWSRTGSTLGSEPNSALRSSGSCHSNGPNRTPACDGQRAGAWALPGRGPLGFPCSGRLCVVRRRGHPANGSSRLRGEQVPNPRDDPRHLPEFVECPGSSRLSSRLQKLFWTARGMTKLIVAHKA